MWIWYKQKNVEQTLLPLHIINLSHSNSAFLGKYNIEIREKLATQ
jgi:hypothetical protein